MLKYHLKMEEKKYSLTRMCLCFQLIIQDYYFVDLWFSLFTGKQLLSHCQKVEGVLDFNVLHAYSLNVRIRKVIL